MEEKKVTVQLLLFAVARELAETSRDELVLPSELTMREIIRRVLSKHPKLELIINNVVIAVNEEYVVDKEQIVRLKDGDEVAIIPPLSGG